MGVSAKTQDRSREISGGSGWCAPASGPARRTVGGSANDDSAHGSDSEARAATTPTAGLGDRAAHHSARPVFGWGWLAAGRASEPELVAHGAHVGVDGRRYRDLANGDIRILETVPGEDTYDSGSGRNA
jgi:hypothetical protein